MPSRGTSKSSRAASENRVAFHRQEANGGGDIWIIEASDRKMSRLTFDASQQNASPVWSPDGSRIVYGSLRNGKSGLYQKRSDGTGPEEKLLESDVAVLPVSWSPDGRALYFISPDFHIMVADVEAKGDAFSPGNPRQWSPVPVWNPLGTLVYSIHPDGKRFAVLPVPPPSPEEKGNAHVTFLLNFGDELRRRIPTTK